MGTWIPDSVWGKKEKEKAKKNPDAKEMTEKKKREEKKIQPSALQWTCFGVPPFKRQK